MIVLKEERELSKEQKQWIVENASRGNRKEVSKMFCEKFNLILTVRLGSRLITRAKEPVVEKRIPNSPLSPQERQWILDNYKAGQKEYGFAYMAKKFQVSKMTIEALIRNSERFKDKSLKPSEYIMTFGKHKGLALSEVPTDYIQWMLRTVNLSEWLHANIEKELELRFVSPQRLVKSQSSKEDSTHYKWTHPDGVTVYDIPNDVSMVGTENELPPF